MRVLTLMADRSVAKLLSLPRHKKLAFLLLMSERMYPSLRSFYVSESLDFSSLQEVRDASWRALQDDDALANWPTMERQVSNELPDTEEFQTSAAVHALYAGLLVADIADFVVDGTDKVLLRALSYPLNAVEHIAGEEHGGMFESKAVEDYISHHPVVLREKHAEERDVEFLAALDDAPWSAAGIVGLQQRAAAQPHLSEPIRH